MAISRVSTRRTAPPGEPIDPLEDWISLVVTQLLAPKQLLFTRSGVLFGFWVGWHVYTADGCYVGSFRDAGEQGEKSELYSPAGEYLGERDPERHDRLGVDLSKQGLRRQPLPALPALPEPRNTLYAVRDTLPPREGWNDFPAPSALESPSGDDSIIRPYRFGEQAVPKHESETLTHIHLRAREPRRLMRWLFLGPKHTGTLRRSPRL